MNLLIINAILAAVLLVAAVVPLLWAIRTSSYRDERNVTATPHEYAAPALKLSPVLEPSI